MSLALPGICLRRREMPAAFRDGGQREEKNSEYRMFQSVYALDPRSGERKLLRGFFRDRIRNGSGFRRICFRPPRQCAASSLLPAETG